MSVTTVSFQFSVAQDKTAQNLKSLGGHAEDMVDIFQANDYAKADSLYIVMQSEVSTLRNQVSKSKEPLLASLNADLSTIFKSIQTRDAMSGALASNQLTATVMQLESFPNNIARAAAGWIILHAREYCSIKIAPLGTQVSWKAVAMTLLQLGKAFDRMFGRIRKTLTWSHAWMKSLGK